MKATARSKAGTITKVAGSVAVDPRQQATPADAPAPNAAASPMAELRSIGQPHAVGRSTIRLQGARRRAEREANAHLRRALADRVRHRRRTSPTVGRQQRQRAHRSQQAGAECAAAKTACSMCPLTRAGTSHDREGPGSTARIGLADRARRASSGSPAVRTSNRSMPLLIPLREVEVDVRLRKASSSVPYLLSRAMPTITYGGARGKSRTNCAPAVPISCSPSSH